MVDRSDFIIYFFIFLFFVQTCYISETKVLVMMENNAVRQQMMFYKIEMDGE